MFSFDKLYCSSARFHKACNVWFYFFTLVESIIVNKAYNNNTQQKQLYKLLTNPVTISSLLPNATIKELNKISINKPTPTKISIVSDLT